MKHFCLLLISCFLLLISQPVFSQFPSREANENEAKVVPYILPDPLMLANGERIKDSAQWLDLQRGYIYHLFEENVYGRYPQKKIEVSYTVRDEDKNALDGKAIRRQVRLFLNPDNPAVYVDVLMYLPKSQKQVPVFLSLNFDGNAATWPDPAIFLSPNYDAFYADHPEKKKNRGDKSTRWPMREIVENGFGVVTAYYGDLELDKPDGWKTGVRTTLKKELDIEPEEWGAIGAWAWGLSRIMDYLEMDSDVNSREVAVMGHSRLGKTALWAGASDPRFSMVISNESGEGGAALSRRWFGETVKIINDHFPHWFVKRYKNYSEDVFALPVDQHELLSLIAPRPLYVASAAGDLWSDPRGEFLSAWHAGEVYKLFNKEGLGTSLWPGENSPVGHTVRYHVRDGKHDVTLYDWEQYMKFAKEIWKRN